MFEVLHTFYYKKASVTLCLSFVFPIFFSLN